MTRIHLSVPHLGTQEAGLVAAALGSNWVSTVGPSLSEFEAAFAKGLGRPSLALASGTAAIHLGLRLLGVGPGDQVMSPTLTFVASVNPIVYLGAEPLFIDSERDSWNLDPGRLEDALKSLKRRPKALVVVHLFGQSANMPDIMALAERYEIPVLEDCAEALGATCAGKPVGVFGEVAAFSFNGNKIITTGGGGMLASRHLAGVDKARFWSTQARDPGPSYAHSELGYNYRMSNVLAAIGVGQLGVLPERVRQRCAVFQRYEAAFARLEGLQPMPVAPWGTCTRWLSVFLVKPEVLGCTRDDLLEALTQANIEARPVWKPMHRQALYQGAWYSGGGVADDLFQRGLCLPSSSSLTESEQGRVIDVVLERVAKARAGRASGEATL